MFDFFSMAFDRESRKVATTEIGGAVIDTCAVTDSARPFETGIQHPEYNGGKWVIVELYDTKGEAELGHKKWVELFSGNKLPPRLVDRNECSLQDLAKAMGHDLRGVYERVAPKKVRKQLATSANKPSAAQG